MSRNVVIAAVVVALHVGLLAALQSGLLMRAAEMVVPAAVLVQFVEPPQPKVEQPPPQPLPQPVEKKVVPAKPVAAPAPRPRAIEKAEPAPNAPTGVVNPPAEPAPITAAPAAPATPPAPPIAPPAPPAPPAVQLPSSDADYLQNPKPPYPPLSKRMGEQGKTIVRVFIGADGQPQRAEVVQSSGFERLDQATIATVMRWRYVPGKRGGVPEAMWFQVPVNWVLE